MVHYPFVYGTLVQVYDTLPVRVWYTARGCMVHCPWVYGTLPVGVWYTAPFVYGTLPRSCMVRRPPLVYGYLRPAVPFMIRSSSERSELHGP